MAEYQGVLFERIVSKPDIVDAASLQPNGSLASDYEVKHFKNYIYNNKDEYFSKKTYNESLKIEFLKHSFLALDGQIYAVHKGEVLGRGGFSKARAAQNVDTKQWVVLKVIKDDDEDSLKFVETEVEMLKQAMQLGSYIQDKDNPKKYRIIMPLAKGMNLETYIHNIQKKHIRPTQHQLLKMAESIALALNKLHAYNILHRDVKPANIMAVLQTLLAELIDLGFASFEKNTHITNLQEVGTNGYMAPEIFKSEGLNPKFKRYSTKSDGYALGVTLAEFFHMAIERKPNKPKTFSHITSIQGSPTFTKLIPDYEVRMELLKLVRDLTCADINKRMDPVNAAKVIRQLYENLDYSYVMDRMVGVVDVSEYESLSPFNKEQMIRSLHEFDQVVLVNDANAKKSPLAIANIHDELIQEGILCRDKVCYFDKNKIVGKNVLSSIQKVLNEEDQLYYYNLCQVSNNKKSTTNLSGTVKEKTIYTSRFKSSIHYQAEIRRSYFGNKVSDSDLNKVQKIIKEDMERIEFKYKNNPTERKARIILIEKSLGELSNNSRLNYGQLKGHLEKLSKDIAKIKRHPYIPIFFQKRSFTSRLAGDLINKVLPPVRKKEMPIDKIGKDGQIVRRSSYSPILFRKKSFILRLADDLMNRVLVQIQKLL